MASFVEACLQIIKPPASGAPLRLPTSLVETVVDALATLVPLYPATLRPTGNQMREAVGRYVAPTSSDNYVVTQPLSRASRRLLISLHHTAPKNGSSEEWTKTFNGFINVSHATADQIFRAVQESWESAVGYNAQRVSVDGEPSGGGSSTEEFPSWSGLVAGSERLVGLLELIADCFRCPTRTPVAIPLGAVMDLVSRVSLLMPPAPGQDDRYQLNPAIGREEKDQLWSVLPDIHVATSQLLLSIVQRLGRSVICLARDMLDQMARMFRSTRHIPSGHKTAFLLAKELLLITGPTLDKLTADSLGLLIQACCRDLLDVAGYTQEPKQDPTPATNGAKGTKGKAPSGNADAFLAPQSKLAAVLVADPAHQAVAGELLTVLLSRLPQRHLSPDSRGLIDRTAILCHNKDAMLASCLYPYKDKNGRYYPSILPFLIRQFPQDQEVEVLRSNLRAPKASSHETFDPNSGLEALLEEPNEEMTFGLIGDSELQLRPSGGDEKAAEIVIPTFLPNVDVESEARPFVPQETAKLGSSAAEPDQTSPWGLAQSPLKRKGDELDSGVSKRLEKGKDVEMPLKPAPAPVQEVAAEDDNDSDSEGSVQIDMTFDDEDEDEDEDEGGDNVE